MNGNRYYGVRVEGAKFGVGFGSALAITISYTENHSILWAIIDGILSWLYVVYFALFRDDTAFPINSKTTQARQGVGNLSGNRFWSLSRNSLRHMRQSG